MSSTRIEKINDLVRQNINDILLKDLSLKEGIFITVAKVDTSPDIRYTRVFISIFPESETDYALKTLQKEIYQIQGALNRRLRLKPLPKLEFRLDTTEREADKIEKLLKEI